MTLLGRPARCLLNRGSHKTRARRSGAVPAQYRLASIVFEGGARVCAVKSSQRSPGGMCQGRGLDSGNECSSMRLCLGSSMCWAGASAWA